MPQLTESTSLDVDIMARLAIQPISCDWSGCTAIINSWFTLQKVCEYFYGVGLYGSWYLTPAKITSTSLLHILILYFPLA
jgi:hypothetical protein